MHNGVSALTTSENGPVGQSQSPLPERFAGITRPYTQKDVEKIHVAHQRGIITEGERYLKVIDAWTHARERIGEDKITLYQRHARGEL